MAGAVLVAVLAVHLWSVGTSTSADEIQCTERCNFRQGYCTPSGKCQPHELLVKTVGQSVLVTAKSEVSNGDGEGANREHGFRCYPGYEGMNCERCQRGPGCVHGTCDKSWQCNCMKGWGGLRCDIDLKVCERTQPCKNYATCINGGNSDYHCVCHPGFSGKNCEQYSAGGMSDNKPTSKPSTTTTKAPTPPPKQCENDGKCQLYGSNGECRKCICKPGYVGLHCVENVNECLMRPCANGGKCFDLSNNFFCECLTGFTSRYCENDVDECKLVSDMCYNGGICTNTFGSFDCACHEGYSGRRCEREDRIPQNLSIVSLIPRMIRVTAAEDHVTETTAAMIFDPKETQRKPRVIKIPNPDVKMARVTHELKITSVNGEYAAADRDSGTGGASAQAMQAMTFVFMGLAISILIAILVVIYLRCFKKQSESTSKKGSESSISPSPISSVDKSIHTRHDSNTAPFPISSVTKNIRTRASSTYDVAVSLTVDETQPDFIDDDEASMQIQPCLTDKVQSYSDQHEAIAECPTPPPPYVLSAIDARRTSIPFSEYYVSLPPVSPTDSYQNVSETSARKSFSTSYIMTSREETTSLLDADSPTLSHKILV